MTDKEFNDYLDSLTKINPYGFLPYGYGICKICGFSTAIGLKEIACMRSTDHLPWCENLPNWWACK